MNQRPTRRQIITVAVVTVLLLLGLVLVQAVRNSRFRIVDSIPSPKGTISTSTNGFRLRFNRELDNTKDYITTINDADKHVKQIDIEGDSLLVVTQGHQENGKYFFEIKDVRANDGSVIPSVRFDYTTKYKPLDSLSKEHRELIQLIAQKPVDDNPIAKYLPYSTLNFKLRAEFDHDEESQTVGDLVLYAELYLTSADVNTGREAAIALYKKEVVNYIKAIGFNPADYKIFYEPIVLE